MKVGFNSISQVFCLKLILFVCIWIFYSHKSLGQSLTITGPTTVCPNNFEPNGSNGGHNFSAQAIIAGLNANCNTWLWFVHKNGVLYEEGIGK